jgi:hypothetical protein
MSKQRRIKRNYHEFMASTEYKRKQKDKHITKVRSRAHKGVWIEGVS